MKKFIVLLSFYCISTEAMQFHRGNENNINNVIEEMQGKPTQITKKFYPNATGIQYVPKDRRSKGQRKARKGR